MHPTQKRGFVALFAVATLAACGSTDTTAPAGSGRLAGTVGETGNGAPSGAHYTLNLIGTKEKNATLDGGDGRRIFVGLGKSGEAATTRILLTEGDFAVLDANGTDGEASFRLPAPDPDGDGTTVYSVYVRTLGKPGGKATLQSCYVENSEEWCAVDFAGGVAPIELERTAGRSKFQNVSKDLLYVDYCAAWDGDVCTDVNQTPLFSNDLIDYLWKYDNQGMRLVQLRFYEVPTTTGF